jgi:hypothetical protein
MDDYETRDLLADFLRWLVAEGYAAARMLPYDASAGDIALRYLDSFCDICGKRHRFGEGGHTEAGVMD